MRDLMEIPGVGKKMKAYLEALGIHAVEDLVGQDPEELYRRDCALRGEPVDRCALYVYRLAVYYAETDRPDPAKLRWWAWKEKP